MPTANNLKAIIARTPRRDREDAALRPTPALPPLKSWKLPETLGELKYRLGSLGQAAIQNVCLSAISAWLWKEPDAERTEPRDVIFESLSLRREELMAISGVPNHNEGPRPNRMPYLSPECQTEARRVVGVTYRDWEKAGKPCLQARDISATYQYFVNCYRNAGEEMPA